MSWAVKARRVRDTSRPLAQRVNALHSLLANHHAPLGFQATAQHLRGLAGVAGSRRLLPWRTRRFVWTEQQLLTALAALEESRGSHLRYQAAFVERRKAEKAKGLRQPSRDDGGSSTRSEWLIETDGASGPSQ